MTLRVSTLTDAMQKCGGFTRRVPLGKADDYSEIPFARGFACKGKPVSHGGKLTGRLPIGEDRRLAERRAHQVSGLSRDDKARRGCLQIFEHRLDEIGQ